MEFSRLSKFTSKLIWKEWRGLPIKTLLKVSLCGFILFFSYALGLLLANLTDLIFLQKQLVFNKTVKKGTFC